MTGISLSNIPQGSKLILLGDWYRRPGSGWHVVCYFLSRDMRSFRKQLPVDLLPALTPGTDFPRVSITNKAKGYTGTMKVPEMHLWKKCLYRDLPYSLQRMHEYSKQIENQIIYRLDVDTRVYWIPAIELARMLFFHSAEVVREAVSQGNTWQLARAEKNDWIGKVIFTSNIPVRYMNSLQFRKFFAWLAFNENAQSSFCSIFQRLNEQSYQQKSIERWTFDFEPPDLGSCGISWAGYTGTSETGEQNHCYIREIRALTGVDAPELEAVDFLHPDDILFLDGNEEGSSKKARKQKSNISVKEIDPYTPPMAGKKRYLIFTGSVGFHFNTEIDLRKSPRQIRALPNGTTPDSEDSQEENTLGIIEGSDHGSNPGVDIDNFEEPDLMNGPEKFTFFQSLLEQLEVNFGWSIETHTGEIPRKRCRSVHMVGNRVRRYLHAIIQRDDTTKVHGLEIELTAEESLSTLLFRSVESEKAVENIVDALMTSNSSKKLKSMQWKRKINVQLTTSRHYLGHPDKKIKNEVEALESWVARAAGKIMNL